MSEAFDFDRAGGSPPPARETAYIAPLPHVSVQAFCETPDISSAIQAAVQDRRMAKAQVKVQMGGVAAAVDAYGMASTPNVIVIESHGQRDHLLSHLDLLAEVCDAGTRVVVIGHVNDVLLYRELIRRGISEYMIAPIAPMEFVAALSGLFTAPGADPLGRVIAITGVKGGVGASTIAHNVGWSIARRFQLGTVIADLDLPFGTAGLDFNQDPPQGIADAVFSADRLDPTLLERLLSKCGDNLSILAAPATLERVTDLAEGAFDPVVDILRGMMPAVILDVPHLWSSWARRSLANADEVVLVAAPDLGNLRNAKAMIDSIRQVRRNDNPPRLVLNQVGVPKRPEIAPADFAKAIGADPVAVIPFDPQLFGTAANNGQMIAEVQASGKVTELIQALSQVVMGKSEHARPKGALTFLPPFLSKLVARKS
jgi:pilus assembly protein CpaE